MPAEYLLSVDLGTSHTVAVVVWPDGRTRPLLFDGSPVMPSAVFLDEAGDLHVGRDAERLGPTAPERLEPNPKQRVADGTLLLGDREIPVTSAFAAILRRVAQQAVEAVGGLPNAVLTCPAAWSEQRRAALHDAAAGAGYPPVQIITEPVAAAHYYTTRLDRPIDPGQALAVFDFGGGTLDIAVVERRPDGGFGVLADGGLSDLGGLDFDAALVAHIGATVRGRDPELWKRLEQPGTATELRDRRTLWDDVRGAKEMLSRSSVAPVTVPGMEQALHLTRGELDQLARPLLSRAVGETRRVLALTGKSPDQLAGLFLVGGSSRMPLVAKVLHEELGIAPAVLEQPELPVSEGAAVALAAPAPVTPPAMASPPSAPSPQTAAYVPGGPPPASDATIALPRPAAPGKRPRRRRNTIIALAAALAAVAIAAPLAWFHFTDPYKQRPFTDLEAVADPVPFASEDRSGLYSVRVWEDRALFAYTVENSGPDGEELHVRALDTRGGGAVWERDAVLEGSGWDSTVFLSSELLALRQEDQNPAGETVYHWYFLDWDDGTVLNKRTNSADWGARSGDHLVMQTGENEITVYDSDGERHVSWSLGEGEDAPGIAQWGQVRTTDDLVRGAEPLNGDGRVWAVADDGRVHLFDIESGEHTRGEAVETPEDLYFAYDGRLYVARDDETGYWIIVYDLEDELKEIDSERVRAGDVDIAPEHIDVCGEARVCVAESNPESSKYTFRVYDSDRTEVVHEFADGEFETVEAVGDRLLVEFYEGDDLRTQVWDKDFEKVGNSLDESYAGIDGGSALAWPAASTFGTSEDSVVGLGVRDGSRQTLEVALTVYACRPSSEHLACFVEEGLQIFRFRES